MSRFVIPHPRAGCNSYLRLLEEALVSRGHQCVFADATVEPQPGDVLWIGWPEHLISHQNMNEHTVADVANWLGRWRRNNIIFWTVHNLHRHGMPLDKWSNALFLLMAESAHVQIHHGNKSVELVKRRFPEAMPQAIRVVNHGGYFNLLGNATRQSARAKLGIPENDRVLLVFGAVRSVEEYQMALDAAAMGWHVLIAGRIPYVRRRKRVQNWFRYLFSTLKITKREGEIPDDEVQDYLKACDAMFLARSANLNSGNLYLAMTFGRAIIGPDIGNIGEALLNTGNYIFDPQNPASLKEVLAKTLKEDLEPLGQANGKWIQENGRWESIAIAAETAIEEVQNADKLQSV